MYVGGEERGGERGGEERGGEERGGERGGEERGGEERRGEGRGGEGRGGEGVSACALTSSSISLIFRWLQCICFFSCCRVQLFSISVIPPFFIPNFS